MNTASSQYASPADEIAALASHLIAKAEEICKITGHSVEDFVNQVKAVCLENAEDALKKLKSLMLIIGVIGVGAKNDASGSANSCADGQKKSISLWESTCGIAKTVNKYGSMPAYGVGYGAGYGVATLVNPILDLVEIVPLVGAVVTGGRDGATKATRHWEFVGQKARAMCSKKE